MELKLCTVGGKNISLGGPRMSLENVKKVITIHEANRVNKLLDEGWVLLDAKVVQLGNRENVMTGGTVYILGKKKEIEKDLPNNYES